VTQLYDGEDHKIEGRCPSANTLCQLRNKEGLIPKENCWRGETLSMCGHSDRVSHCLLLRQNLQAVKPSIYIWTGKPQVLSVTIQLDSNAIMPSFHDPA